MNMRVTQKMTAAPFGAAAKCGGRNNRCQSYVAARKASGRHFG